MDWFEQLAGGTRGRLLTLLRRSRHTINELAVEVGISDNAVRTHIASLERDGMVEPVEVDRATGGKPAQRYALTAAAEELFPKAYALVLTGVVRLLVERDGERPTVALLRDLGARVARTLRPAGVSADASVAAAAEALRELGGDVEVERTAAGGWRIQGYGCPLSGVVRDCEHVCELAEALVHEITGLPVTQRCERTERPRCAFEVAAAS